jgi:hypothetical protein
MFSRRFSHKSADSAKFSVFSLLAGNSLTGHNMRSSASTCSRRKDAFGSRASQPPARGGSAPARPIRTSAPAPDFRNRGNRSAAGRPARRARKFRRNGREVSAAGEGGPNQASAMEPEPRPTRRSMRAANHVGPRRHRRLADTLINTFLIDLVQRRRSCRSRLRRG